MNHSFKSMIFILISCFYCTVLIAPVAFSENENAYMKTASVLYPEHLRDTAILNASQYGWAKTIQNNLIQKARPWLDCTDEELWESMFGPDITRTWMVWSDGICPSCRKDVKMYTWKIDIWNHPFKVQCPHCQQLFPTNDFQAYYHSGLDENGVFVPGKADRQLLYNQDHPGTDDLLRMFGVDDGEGYVEGNKRWRFIGYYLIAGQWRQKIVGGITNLSEAYFVTGNPVYARKAAILLDRIADLYPLFDFQSQGLVYEKSGHRGYVTVWHDACEEVRELAQAYDRIYDGIRNDNQLVAFLSQKAKQYQLESTKTNFADIQKNIEVRIFQHTLDHKKRIDSNFPNTPIALLTMETVLGWPNNRERIISLLSDILTESVKEDGMTGEKGLSGYTTIFPRSFAKLISRFDRLDSSLLPELFKQFPDLHKTYRFHIDTWCMEKYYPREGDCSCFGGQCPNYLGAICSTILQNTEPSMFQFLWRIFEITHDPDFVKVLFRENNFSTKGLPYDICVTDPLQFEQRVQKVIQKHGCDFKLGDINLEQWGLSILRSGEGANRRAVWLDHDSGGRHSHHDGLNIGLFAKGVDLLPDFGYPPVGYGGWNAPKAVWYKQTAAHNTVVVDGKDHKSADGKTTLWGSGKQLDMVSVSAPELIDGDRYERTLVKVDISENDFYVIDLFQVSGGRRHELFIASNLGDVTTKGIVLDKPIELESRYETRNFISAAHPSPGWYADWKISAIEEKDRDIHLRYTALTKSTQAALGECWIDTSNTFGGQEQWIPRLLISNSSENNPLSSQFIGILEPYENHPFIKTARLVNDSDDNKKCIIIIELHDGRKQILLVNRALDNNLTKCQIGNIPMECNAEIGFASLRDGIMEYAALCNGSYLKYGEQSIKLDAKRTFKELLPEK